MVQGDDTITLTRDDLQAMLLQVKPNPADFAAGYRLYVTSEQEQQASESAQERLVMGVFGSWFKRRWKHVTTVAAIVGALGGGVWKAWGWLQFKAEEQVLERHAAEQQAKAVEGNTAAVDELARTQGDLTDSLDDLDREVAANSRINQLLLQVQLRDPRTKRVIKADKKLKADIEQVTGTEIK